MVLQATGWFGGKEGGLVVFVDRGQTRGRVKGLVDLGLGCGLFVIWAQSVD